MKKITIIMPCLNVVQYFKECMDSVVKQTIFRELEVIVIDAGSTDGTYEIASFYAEKYENIRVITSDKRSYGYQVNYGIKESNCKYIAILETDDYVRDDMYDILYKAAEKNQVDYVKADYNMFYVCRNGSKVFKRMPVSKMTSDYNHVMDTSRNMHMNLHDYSVWKGIYRKDFLVDNNIWFNESPGAAYQDIGFGQLLHAKAKRALYLPDALYQYRVGREQASMNSGRGIIYTKNEFEHLFEIQNQHELFYPGLYTAMVGSFLSGFSLLESYNSITDESIIECSKWIGKHVEEALSKGIISDELVSQELGPNKLEKFSNIQKDIVGEIRNLINRKRERRMKWSAWNDSDESVYIFGAGNYGMNALRVLDSCGVRINGFLDNHPGSMNQVYGIEVSVPTNKIVQEKAKIVIANLYYAEEIRQQLLDLGVAEEKIMEYKN